LWTNGKYLLSDFTQNRIKQLPEEGELHDDITRIFNESYAAKMSYAHHFPIPLIEYFLHCLRHDSHNFGSMFANFYSCTASPNDDESFPMGTAVFNDPGTAWEFIDFVIRTWNENSLVTIESRTPNLALQNILDKCFTEGSEERAIIDSGALFYGLTNQ